MLPIKIDPGRHKETLLKWFVAQVVNVASKSPVGSGALLLRTLSEQTYERTGIFHGQLGIQIDLDKASWIPGYQGTTSDIYSHPSKKVNILSPANENKSGRSSSSSFQQNGGRPGTKSGTRKVSWSRKGGKWHPSCPSGFKLRRIGKRLMCVKS